jgi:hypothetical protein
MQDTGDPTDRANWPVLSTLGPHVMASGAIASALREVHRLVIDHVRFLSAAGDPTGGAALARRVEAHWRVSLGPDHPSTRAIAAL